MDMSNVQQMFNQITREIEKQSEEIADTIFSAPQAEVMVKRATNNDQWGPSGTEMMKIADLTNTNHANFRLVFDTLWMRITERKEGKNWRNVYKALLLLDYLLKNGSDKVIGETRSRLYELKMLTSFQYVDSTGVDRGLSIKERTKQIMELCNDSQRLKEERKVARNNRGKFITSISSDTPGHYASQDYFKKTDPYYGKQTLSSSPNRKSQFDESEGDDTRSPPNPKTTTHNPPKKPNKSTIQFSDTESDSEKCGAMQEVPVKQQWDPWSDEPAATATTKNKPFVDDVDWSDFEKPVQMPSVPVQQPQPFTQIPNQSQYQLQNQTQYQPQNQTQYQPQRLQTESGSKLQTQQQVDSMWGAPLQPTPIEPNKQTFIIAPTQQAKIDKDDPWAVGSHLFSLSNVKEPKGVPFGAAGLFSFSCF
eukprot:TRINITY_DN1876_c0_g1_i36.p1 TRINITY_DN1876_c0_g1~~TRINITY_DN1876_c0_g1_i36.p1  ORF type:complete len:421 (-),score=90.82 TRINITY_DN1876_c0_g1_i36:95-1357(-)